MASKEVATITLALFLRTSREVLFYRNVYPYRGNIERIYDTYYRNLPPNEHKDKKVLPYCRY
jgi:hypothetical protein